jgi:hypothetical protein
VKSLSGASPRSGPGSGPWPVTRTSLIARNNKRAIAVTSNNVYQNPRFASETRIDELVGSFIFYLLIWVAECEIQNEEKFQIDLLSVRRTVIRCRIDIATTGRVLE